MGYITCPYCGFKIIVDEIVNGKYCPLCGMNIRKFISVIDDDNDFDYEVKYDFV